MIYGNKFYGYNINSVFIDEFTFFKKKNKYECPVDKETKDKILDAAEKSAEKINSKYLSRVKSMMKKPNHKNDTEYSKEDIDEINFNNITVQFNHDCYDIIFEDIHQDPYFDIDQELEIWDDIANILKNDINKVITNNEFKIKKYQIVDDSAVIVLIFKP